MTSTNCDYCNKVFKTRGLKLHQRKCSAMVVPESTISAPLRVEYKFCIINDDIFNHVLSFLRHQSMTKLQSITGDRYPSCTPLLAAYCCSGCDNDNPAISDGLCTRCYLSQEHHQTKLTKTDARALYGLKHVDAIPCQVYPRYTLYERTTLDKYMIESFGSKLNWLNNIVRKDAKKREAKLVKEQRKKLLTEFLSSTSDAFQDYLRNVYIIITTVPECVMYQRRFNTLTRLLQERDLRIRSDSRLCKEYILHGRESLVGIVDTMEEMQFLFKHTEYAKRSNNLIKQFRKENREFGSWMPRDEFNMYLQSCRDQAKVAMFLRHMTDVIVDAPLPHKWLECKQRLNEVLDTNRKLTSDGVWNYVYHNEGSLDS